jgi:two-component system sensor histidine kinase CpxA
MRIRTRILVTALANVILVGAAVVALMALETGEGMKSILLAPGEGRLRLLAHNLMVRLRDVPAGERTPMVDAVGRENGVTLGLFLNAGSLHVAGSLTGVPAELSRLSRKGKRGERFGPPIPRDEPGRGGRPPGPQHPIAFHASGSGYWFLVPTPVVFPGEELPEVGFLLVRSASLFNPLIIDVRPWLVCILAITGVTLVCWAPVIAALSRAIRQIHSATERYAEGEFQAKLPMPEGGGEVREVAESLNRMALQLGGFVYGQKRFLGDIAHELAAPVARTQAAICILEERLAGRPESRWVDSLREEVEQMSELVGELLAFSKAGLKQPKCPPKPVDVEAVATRAIAREAAGQATVRLVSGGAAWVSADGEGLTRAIGNLIRNANRYAGAAGEITVEVRRAQEHVFVTVADRGPGVPEEMVEQVFQPFFRVDDSRSRESGGTGLGLAIVKAAVNASGGKVWCRNRPEGGLEVVIRLMAAQPSEDRARAAAR